MDNQHSCKIVPATREKIILAARLIRDGGLIAFPTETVYGLGADARNDNAVDEIFVSKGRPRNNPVIIHLASSDIDMFADNDVYFDDRAWKLALYFWPGPLTLVLRRKPKSTISHSATSGLATIATRVPDNVVAQCLLKEARCPIAAPSANCFGHVSPTAAEHVDPSLYKHTSMILDGGPCRIGVESTVIDLSSDRATLLRPGGLQLEKITSIIGHVESLDYGVVRKSPGMLPGHYAPNLPMRLNATDKQPGEVLLGFGPEALPKATLNLSPSANLAEAAANLFGMLRTLDRPEHTRIAVMPIPEAGLGQAINDRLRRAATRTID